MTPFIFIVMRIAAVGKSASDCMQVCYNNEWVMLYPIWHHKRYRGKCIPSNACSRAFIIPLIYLK